MKFLRLFICIALLGFSLMLCKGNCNLIQHNAIEKFELAGTQQILEIEDDNIIIYVPYETDLTNIQTAIVVSDMASVTPSSGTYVNFTNPQQYTVTSNDGTRRDYQVTVKKSPWRKVGNGPFSVRDDITLIELNDRLYMLRGWLDSNPFPAYSREIWSTEDGTTWIKALAEVPWDESVEFKNYLSFVKFHNQIWVFGAGKDGNETWNTIDGVNWTFVNNTSITSTWGRRYWPCIGAFMGKIYVVGGLNWWDVTGAYIRNLVGAGVYNDVWSSDDGIHWIQEKPFSQLPPRGMTNSFAVLDDMLFIVGGGVSNGAVTLEYSDVWASSNGKDWVCYNANTPWGKTAYNSVTVHENKIFLATGTLNGANTSNQVWCSSDGKTWNQVKHCFFPKRHASGLASFKGKLWLVAGGPSGLNDIWCYSSE